MNKLPVISGKTCDTLRAIIRHAGLTVEKFLKLL